MSSEPDLQQWLSQLSEQQRQLVQNLQSGQLQMRNLAKRVWRVQEDERKQIARELHDGVGQLLTALINQLQQVAHEHSEVDLTGTLDLAKQALADTREISRLMRPRILDDLGLVAALEWLVRVMSEKSEIDIKLHTQVDAELDGETQTLGFRVVQESITNAIKHAECQFIQVQLIVSEQLFILKVRDDGKGMSQSELSVEKGFGLAAMQDRVAAFGGQLSIASSPGAGTEIKVVITGRRQS